MTTANERIVRESVQAFNSGDMPALRQRFSDDALIQGVTGSGGLDAIVPIRQQLHAAFAFELNVEALI